MASSTASGGARANGVLPMPTSQTPANGSRQAAAKQPSQKLKLIVRRLAPALTEAEFLSIIGEDWEVGKGKVDWFRYQPGKDSKDAAKPSRPSRAYVHLTNEAHLHPFSDLVRQSNFEDAQNTFTNSCLVGPPVVEFAPYNRIPAGRPRVDARAGTIDQDGEFMAFLEGLANPVTAADAVGEAGSAKQDKVTTTPLVQFLKEKKASKTKEAALKAAKKQEAKSKSSSSSSQSPEDIKKKGKEAKPERALERAAKEAVKILNREAAKASTSTAQASAGPSTPLTEASSDTPKLDISKVPPRQRSAATAAHIRMLQRDLGFSPAQAHRQVKRDTADAQKAERAAAGEKAGTSAKDSSTSSAQASSAPTAQKTNSTQPNSRRARGKASNDPDSGKATNNASNKGGASQGSGSTAAGPSTPVILLRKPEATPSTPNTTNNTPPTTTAKLPPTVLARKPQAAPVPTEGATQAFVKHANPSQGVTEALLKEAMEKFGGVSHVEIDKRKGFAYVDFVDTDGLKKAMAANPISVGQGTVQVLQRKGTVTAPEKKPQNHPQNTAPRGGRGGGGGGRGGTVGRRGGRGGGRGGGNAQANGEASKAPSSAPTGPATK